MHINKLTQWLLIWCAGYTGLLLSLPYFQSNIYFENHEKIFLCIFLFVCVFLVICCVRACARLQLGGMSPKKPTRSVWTAWILSSLFSSSSSLSPTSSSRSSGWSALASLRGCTSDLWSFKGQLVYHFFVGNIIGKALLWLTHCPTKNTKQTAAAVLNCSQYEWMEAKYQHSLVCVCVCVCLCVGACMCVCVCSPCWADPPALLSACAKLPQQSDHRPLLPHSGRQHHQSRLRHAAQLLPALAAATFHTMRQGDLLSLAFIFIFD